MAYVTNGIINLESSPQKNPKEGTYFETKIINNPNYGLYVTQDLSQQNPWEVYTVYAYPLNNASKKKNCPYSYDTIRKNKDGTIDNIAKGTDSINKYPVGTGLYSLNGTSVVSVKVSTTIPIFNINDTESINNYINKGDTSGAIKNVNTDWNLYIDGTKNPLYKLTWKCADIPKSDTSRVKVLFCASDNMINDTYIVKDAQYYEYNDKSVKLNYHDIRDAVWGDAGGGVKSPVTIIVQFEYFETTTVVPKDSSSYMYCELYPNETNGHMYGNIGFCKVGEHSTWFVKTDSGDGSTFTAHDGTDGSDGYTKDDDKGYEDNKDKDDDDDDTHVLSSGIGVLTSTFHMTKERLVQLGQFLWGSSIFNEFSLINNNPIENIISCKAIPYAISGTTQEITLGNVKTGVNGEKISQNFSKQTIGSVAIAEHYKNFLDYAPYTNVIIYLPYIGFKELDTSLVMGKTLRIEYTLDVITGGCLAQIYVGKIRLYEFTGNIGVDISITASNRAQVESAYINAGVGVVSSAMSGNVTGAVNSIIGAATSQYHYSGTGNPSPSCVASTNRTCYVVIDRPQYQPLKAFNHTRGRMCCLSKTIGNLKGYTVCDGNIDISGISATDEEKDEIVNILSTGFFA